MLAIDHTQYILRCKLTQQQHNKINQIRFEMSTTTKCTRIPDDDEDDGRCAETTTQTTACSTCVRVCVRKNAWDAYMRDARCHVHFVMWARGARCGDRRACSIFAYIWRTMITSFLLWHIRIGLFIQRERESPRIVKAFLDENNANVQCYFNFAHLVLIVAIFSWQYFNVQF